MVMVMITKEYNNRQNARQIRERHFYNGTTLEMKKVMDLLKESIYFSEDPKPVTQNYHRFDIIQATKKARKSLN